MGSYFRCEWFPGWAGGHLRGLRGDGAVGRVSDGPHRRSRVPGLHPLVIVIDIRWLLLFISVDYRYLYSLVIVIYPR